MKYHFQLLVFCLLVLHFNNAYSLPKQTKSPTTTEELRSLIRNMLIWSESNRAIDQLPSVEKDGICIGFDFQELDKNLSKLRASGFFADEFIDNYKCIVETLDKKVKNKELPQWLVREPIPAAFGLPSDAVPWCLCQDNLSWDKVEIEIIRLEKTKGELKWNWGKLDSTYHPSWGEFRYTFRVVKVDNKWKISYLEGFDFAGCPTRKK